MAQSKKSGIDINLGNQCSRTAYSWAKKTFSNRPSGSGNPLINVDGVFSNIMDYHGVKVGMSSDGIGTKIELAERTGIYDTLGWDLVAMTADDLIANGIEPVNISNILDVDFLDHDIIDALMRGLNQAVKVARITVTGGEIAELGGRISGYGTSMHFNWCSTATGLLPEGADLIDGTAIRPGYSVIALASRGFRSNGFSLIRSIMEKTFGPEWHLEPYNDISWGEALLAPCRIYAPAVADMLKTGIPVVGVAHITGGGIGDNFERVLKASGLGADLTSLFDALPLMKDVQRLGNVDEATAYRLWNMGNGMLLVCSPEYADGVVNAAINAGCPAKIAGSISARGGIRIRTGGCSPQLLNYEPGSME